MGSLHTCILLLTLAAPPNGAMAPPAGTISLAGVSNSQPAPETVLLDFTATWCGPCQTMRPTVERLAAAGYPVRAVDIDQHRDLAARYRIDSIPCFVMLVNGTEVGRAQGICSEAQLLSMLAKGRPPAPREDATKRATAAPHTSGTSRAHAQSPDNVPLVPLHRAGPSESYAHSSGAANRPENGAAAACDAPISIAELTERLLVSTVRLKVEDDNSFGFGTGTIIDARDGEALVLTCGHLFRESDGKRPIWVELVGIPGTPVVEGRLVSYDLQRDLGLVSFRPGRPVSPLRVADLPDAIKSGQPVVSVGCNNGEPPTALGSHITSIDRYQGPRNIEVSGMPVQGRSGGGLFNAQGRLIGVCLAADPQDKEGMYSHLEEIHDELTRVGLREVCLQNGNSMEVPAGLVQVEPPAMPERMPRGMSGATANGVAATGHESPGPVTLNEATDNLKTLHLRDVATGSGGRLSAGEQAALDEIRSRGEEAEVICIIRPLSDPTAKSEIIVINRASPEFIEQISRAQTGGTRRLTSMDVRRGKSVADSMRQYTAKNPGSIADSQPRK